MAAPQALALPLNTSVKNILNEHTPMHIGTVELPTVLSLKMTEFLTPKDTAATVLVSRAWCQNGYAAYPRIPQAQTGVNAARNLARKNQIKAAAQRSRFFEGVLMVMTVAAAIITLIPPLRFAGSLALRGIACLSAFNLSVSDLHATTLSEKASRFTKVVLVALGIVGIALSSPIFIVASLAIDTLLELKALVETIKNVESIEIQDLSKIIVHCLMIVINILVLTAIVLGAWQLIVAASAISGFLMIALILCVAMKAEGSIGLYTFFYILCSVALIGVGIAGIVIMSEIDLSKPKEATFDLKNDTEYTQYVYDKHSHLIAKINPHESVHFTLPYKDLLHVENHSDKLTGDIRVITPSLDLDSGLNKVPTNYPKPNLISFDSSRSQHHIANKDIQNTHPGGANMSFKVWNSEE